MKRVLFIVLVVLISGCASTRPAVNNSSIQEVERSTQTTRERVTDSTLIDRLREVIIRNDTVYIHDSVYIYKWRDRDITDTITDTLYIEKIDTVTQFVEVEKKVEVEKPVAPFVRNSCIALWVMIGAALIALVIWLVWGIAKGKFSWAKIITKIIGLIR